MKKYILLLLLIIPFKVYAEDAKEITKDVTFTVNNSNITRLSDSNEKTYITLNKGSNLIITNPNAENINQLYIVYELSSKTGSITTSDSSTTKLGENNFLHEYVDTKKNSSSVTLTYDEDVKISEIRVFSEGNTPSDVQKWVKETKTDLMIFSTHADDEQLFFAGVMPTYINQGKKVHVVYLARHDVGLYYAPSRMHEQLNGLWSLGVTDYPTFGLIPDAYSESLEVARSQMNNAGFTDEDVIKFDVEQIRKYKPYVILGHDENGEYGHGQHRLNTYTLKEAIKKAEDESYVLESNLPATKIYKFYIHLYNPDNYTILDYDIPLDKYNGKTAYEVSKEGYSKHLSQQYTWFTDWLNGKNNSYTSAKQITKYNPTYWGLYYSSVGEDVNKNDLFENIPEEKNEIEKNKKETVNKVKKKIIKKSNTIKDYIKKFINNKKYMLITISTVVELLIVFIIIKRRK